MSLDHINQSSSVLILCDDNINSKQLLAMNELGESLKFCADNTCRGSKNDNSRMHIIGKGKMGNGLVGTYKLTNASLNISNATSNLTPKIKQYYEEIGLSNDIREMNQCRKHGQMNDIDFFTSSIVQSQNLVNAGHYDVDDSSYLISTWTESNIGSADEWYFIMPNTTRDGCRGIAIALRHGVTIRWNGRKIFHCSTIGDKGENNNVYGTFFGTKK